MPDLTIDVEEAQKFLDALFGSPRKGFVEHRLLGSRREPPWQAFLADADPWPWQQWQAAQDAGRNVYVGVCPRRIRQGQKGAVGTVPALWVDVDAKHHGDSKEAALAGLSALSETIPFSALIDTGHGYHAYWFLQDAVELDSEDFDADVSYIEGLNRGLAARVGGDRVWSLDRIMRVPGSWNVKDPQHPLPCKFLLFEPDRRYGLDSFASFYVEVSRLAEPIPANPLPAVPAVIPDSLPISEEVRTLCRGDLSSVQGDRSRALYRIARGLLVTGLSPDEAAARIKAIDAEVPNFGKYVGRADDTEYHRVTRKAAVASDRERVSEAAAKAPARGKGLAVAVCVRDMLKQKGRFITFGHDAYYIAGGRLYFISTKSTDLAVLLRRFGISAASQQFHYVVAELEAEAHGSGSRLAPSAFAHYDEQKHAVYVSTNGRMMYRADEHAVAQIENGDDDVIFESFDNVQSLPVELAQPQAGLLDELIFGAVSLEDGAMTVEEQRLLLKVWFYELFFREALPTRALLMLTGEKGSTKTTALNLMGRLLMGSEFNVGAVPKSADDFDVVMHRTWLAAFDNVDEHVPWLKDRLAIAATGNAPLKRELYTSKDTVSMPYRAFVALTSREPKMARDDVADRMLILNTKAVDHKIPAWTLYSAVDRERSSLISEVLQTISKIVGELRAVGDDTDLNIRLADFGRVGLAVARALGREVEFRSAIENLEGAQGRFLVENDSLAPYVIELARQLPDWWEGSPSELFAKLSSQTGFTTAIRNPTSLGKRIKQLRPSLGGTVEIEIIPGARSHSARYRIGPLEGVAEHPLGNGAKPAETPSLDLEPVTFN